MSPKSLRNSAVLASAGLAATSLAMIPAGAMAAADCGPDGTEVSAGICEAAFTTAGDYTFTAPAGVTKLAGVLVGAGGGSEYNADGAYGGGGGDVIYVDSLSVTTALTITVGAGGAADGNVTGNAGQGGDTSIGSDVATGGYGGTSQGEHGGDSGNGFLGSSGYSNTFYRFAGGGAGAAEDAPDCFTGVNTSSCPGGSGVAVSSVATDATLFPAVLGETEYAAGGYALADLSVTSVGDHPAGHGGDGLTDSSGDDGNDGAVFLRWAAPALPDTGMTVQPWMIGTAAAAVAAGAIFTSGLLRTRRKGRHSA